MSRKRLIWTIAGGAVAVAVALFVAAVLVVQSNWFYGKVRARLVDTLEKATGARVEISAFHFDWKTLRAQVTGLTLHGTEPAGSPPLLHADSVTVGLKIISLLKRDVNVQDLEVDAPRVYLIVYPDGRTNVPEPKVRSENRKSTVETLLDLAIGRFALLHGEFEVSGKGATPFELRGDNLRANLDYDRAGPRYLADIAMQPLEAQVGSYKPLPIGLTLSASVERNRIALRSVTMTSGNSRVDLSGAIESFESPHGSFQYRAHVAVPEASKVLRIPELRRGTVMVNGSANWAGAAVTLTGALHATGMEYLDATIHLRDFRAEGALRADTNGVELAGLKLSGQFVTRLRQEPVDMRIARANLHGPELSLRDIEMAAEGGSFRGTASVRNLDRYAVSGDVTGFEARRVVSLYSAAQLPWNARVTGPMRAQGSFRRPAELHVSGTLAVAPASDSAPVHGEIEAAWDAAQKRLDLGQSSLTLPASQVNFSGAIPAVPAHPMHAHLETRNLDDLLPAIDARAADLPVKLTGSLVFDGSVTGTLDDPRITGHTAVTGMEYSGEKFDSAAADVEVSPAGVQLRNASAALGAMRAVFQAAVVLDDWKPKDSGAISAGGSVRNAPVHDLSALLGIKDLPVTGTVAATAKLTGTIGSPAVDADVTMTHGVLEDEPFDRFTGHMKYDSTSIDITGGHVTAGTRDAMLEASYRHTAGGFDRGRLHVQLKTNAMALDQFHAVSEHISDVKGTVQAAITGDFDLAPNPSGDEEYRIDSLTATLAGHGLGTGAQSIGDATLTVGSQNSVLRAHLDSSVADSQIHGDGQWRLEGDDPGSATIVFSKLDLARLRQWLGAAPANSEDSFVGSAEGQLRIDGSLLHLQALRAELQIPQFQIGPPPGAGLPAGTGVLKNSGPIVVSLTNNVVTVESAHLVGPSTDLTVKGKVQIRDKNPLDVQVNGHIDLAILHELNRDFIASGTVSTAGTVRGTLDAPQVAGRMEFKDAAFSIVDFPNGISKAAGAILFTKDRATIQSFHGETGGGEIDLTGFADEAEGQLLFRLHASAKEVRVRYPEGVSTVADANLSLSGTTDRSILAGSLTIVRTAFNPQSDLSSLLAKSAEPVATSAARTGLLGGLSFDVQINTSPNIQFQSALTHNVQMDANLRLRGTFGNPALLGRINITQGQISFFGTSYNLTNGTVTFLNPVKVDPILDIDLETKARGIDITLNVSGPLDKPTLTPRSDPPLQFNEIVALLATGRSPTSDPTLLAQQNTAPQSWQQMGASALLGQAIASPVAGRLQRFFGVSQLRIDPSLPGVENNPQARLTLEQQVTADITFTYITDVTTSNPEVVRMEWAFAKQWSVVALREQNGLFGLDFFFKKQF